MPLTSLEDMRLLLSTQGVLSWSDHNSDGFEDASVIQPCIDYATASIGGKLVKRYTILQLEEAPVIAELACVIACRTLCYRRGNQIPEVLELRYQEIIEKDGLLDHIASGSELLINSAGEILVGRAMSAPTMSNMTVDRRFWHEPLRVKQQSSTPIASTQERDFAPSPGASYGQ